MFTKKQIAAIKQMSPVSFLATVDGEQPRLRAMTHYVDANLTIWYPSLKRSGKVDQILANPHVAVSFLDAEQRRAPITVYGTADIIEDRQTIAAIYRQYEDTIQNIVPADPEGDNFVLIRVTSDTVVDNIYKTSNE